MKLRTVFLPALALATGVTIGVATTGQAEPVEMTPVACVKALDYANKMKRAVGKRAEGPEGIADVLIGVDAVKEFEFHANVCRRTA